MTIGRPLFAKLFLEGIEVPLIGATVTSTINQATIAYIDLVPHEIINEIRPRTLVHLFIRDVNNVKGGHPYVLAFQGEVFGINFSKSTNSRTLSISCIDSTSYWDNILSYFFNPTQSLGKGSDYIARSARDMQTATKGANGSVAVTHSTTSYYRKVMDSAFAQVKAQGRSPDLFDGLVAIVKAISDVNEYYSAAEDRLRISDRIAAASSGDVSNLLKQTEAMEWLMGVADRHSGFTTLRSVVNDLMSLIFHDSCSITFPGLVEQDSVKKSLTPITQGGMPTTIGEFIFKPNMYMIAPPICNVFFPDEYSSFTYSRNFFTEPTRLVYKPELPSIMGTSPLSLPHVFEPEAFDHFMAGEGAMPDSLRGDEATQADKDYGKYGDDELVNGKKRESSNGKKREQAFLSNEEKFKGIMIAQESMVPSSSAFRQALDDTNRLDYSKKIAKYLFYKKRFETRQIQITSHLKMSVVPGFAALVLDNSSAKQNIVAYCSSVTHRIYCNQGGYTNTTLSYARTVNEQDVANGKSGEPLIPPWFKKEIFGEKVKEPTKSPDKEVDKKVSEGGKQVETPDALSGYYKKLLGTKGSLSVNQYTREKTLVGAVENLLKEYNANRKKGNEAVSGMIDKITRRRYISMNEAFDFLGAKPVGGSKTTSSFMEYYGDRLFGKDASLFDSKQLKARREVIRKYRDALKNNRGFRG